MTALPGLAELRQHGLKLGTTKPWQQRRWRQLGLETRRHLRDMALNGQEVLAYMSVMNDLGFSAKAAQDLKRYLYEGGEYQDVD